MTDRGPVRGQQPFDIRELEGTGGSPEDLTETTRIARELEVVADRSGAAPTAEFAERVMSAVAVEPVPAPARAAGVALRAGAAGAFLASLRDAWRVTLRGGFPAPVRAQALALVLVVVGVASGSGLAVAGAVGLFDGNHAAPTPPPAVVTPVPTVGPVSPEPEASSTPEPSGSVEPSPEPTTEPSDTAEPTDTPDGEGGGEAPTVKATKAPSWPASTATPSPTRTHEPEDDSPGATETPEPGSDQQPWSTHEPDGSPAPTGTPDGGSGG
jgi:hypothetical protein